MRIAAILVSLCSDLLIGFHATENRDVEKPTPTHKSSGEIARSKREAKLVYGGRSVSRRLSGANACDRVVAGGQVSPGRLLSSCGHENRAGVSGFASMAGKSVS